MCQLCLKIAHGVNFLTLDQLLFDYLTYMMYVLPERSHDEYTSHHNDSEQVFYPFCYKWDMQLDIYSNQYYFMAIFLNSGISFS